MNKDDQKQIGIILLAAGSASRMGMPKQLLVYDRQPLILHILDKLIPLGCPITVVLGARASLIRPVLAHLPITIIAHEEWADGMGGSMQAGLRTHLDKQAVLLCVVDQPFLEETVLTKLLACVEQTPAPEKVIAAARYTDGTLGVPALFGRNWFEQLLALPPESGARKLLRANKHIVKSIDFPMGNFDLDRPEDWESFRENH